MSKPYIVGIAGGTCSGKSTLAEMLFERFASRAKLINMDNYFKKDPPNTVAPVTRKVYPEHNHPETLELERLYQDLGKEIASGNSRLIIVEGIFSLYLEDILRQLDLKVFVDLKSDERLVRRIKRFSQMGQTIDEIADRYIDTVRFRHDELVEPTRWRADIVLNGTLNIGKGVELLSSYIEKQIGE